MTCTLLALHAAFPSISLCIVTIAFVINFNFKCDFVSTFWKICVENKSGALTMQIPSPLSVQIITCRLFIVLKKKTDLTVSTKISDVIQELLILPKCTALDVLYDTYHVVRSDIRTCTHNDS